MTKKAPGPASAPQGAPQEERPPTWNRGLVGLAGGAGVILLIVIFSIFSGGPRQGSILYGICDAFLEQNIAYPETIRRASVEQYPKATRIHFTSIDAFGQYKMEMIECSFAQDNAGNLRVDKVFFNRREMDAGKVKKFNISIPAIIAAEPDLSLPEPMPDILKDIR